MRTKNMQIFEFSLVWIFGRADCVMIAVFQKFRRQRENKFFKKFDTFVYYSTVFKQIKTIYAGILSLCLWVPSVVKNRVPPYSITLKGYGNIGWWVI